MLKEMQAEGGKEEKVAGLRQLTDEDLAKLSEVRAQAWNEAEHAFWEVASEEMARAVRVAWPTARYLGMRADAGEYGEYWSVDSVHDASGGTLASIESEGEEGDKVGELDERFSGEWRHIYELQHGIADNCFYDLETGESLNEQVYTKSLAGKEVG